MPIIVVLPEVLHAGDDDHLGEGSQLAEDQPDVDHLHVGRLRQALHLADEDGGHDQHGRQVDAQGRLEEARLEEGGGVGDEEEQSGWQIRRHHLACYNPLHPQHQVDPLVKT